MMESPHQVLEAALKGSGHSPAMQGIYRERFGTAMLCWAVEISRDLREEPAPGPEVMREVMRVRRREEELEACRRVVSVAVDIEACLRSGVEVPEFMQKTFTDRLYDLDLVRAKAAEQEQEASA